MSGIMEKHIAALEANTDAVARHNELLEKIIAGAGAVADKAPSTRKSKTADKAKGDDDDDKKVDADDLTATLDKVKTWLKEFSEAGEDDPENDARAAKLSGALTTLGVDKISNITKESDRVRAEAWVEKMIEKGRLTGDLPKPKTTKKAADDEI